jgi:hypothetical protein
MRGGRRGVSEDNVCSCKSGIFSYHIISYHIISYHKYVLVIKPNTYKKAGHIRATLKDARSSRLFTMFTANKMKCDCFFYIQSE